MKKFVVGVADVYGYDQNDNELFRGKTMLNTSIETSLSNTDVRAGKGNQLQYVYYHTAEMNITVEDAQFSLEFLGLNVGSSIKVGANMFDDETVAVTAGTGVVSKMPLTMNTPIAYGYVSMPDGSVERVEFTGGTTFVLSGANANYTGDVCVRYYTNQITAREVTIYADMMPSNIKLVLDATLASSDVITNKIGTVQIIVYRAASTGNFTLNLTPDAVSSTSLNLRALSYTPVGVQGGCEGNRPIYAEVIEFVENQNWYDGVISLAVEGGAITLEEGQERTIRVYAFRNDSTAPFLAPTNDLTFSSSDTDFVTADGGVITAVAEGSATVTVAINEVPTINATVPVTVVAAA